MAVIPESKTLPFEDQPFIKLNPQAMAEYMRRLVKSLEFQLKEISEVVNQNSRQLGDVENGNYIEFGSGGDITFHGGAGLLYGCLNFHTAGAGTPTTCTTINVWYQITAFNINAQSNGGVVPDHTNDHITIGKAGDYQTFMGVSGGSTTANNDFEIAVFKNNGATQVSAITVHVTVPTANKVQTGSMMCFANLSAADTLEVWVRCVSGSGKIWTTDHVVLNAKQVGG